MLSVRLDEVFDASKRTEHKEVAFSGRLGGPFMRIMLMHRGNALRCPTHQVFSLFFYLVKHHMETRQRRHPEYRGDWGAATIYSVEADAQGVQSGKLNKVLQYVLLDQHVAAPPCPIRKDRRSMIVERMLNVNPSSRFPERDLFNSHHGSLKFGPPLVIGLN